MPKDTGEKVEERVITLQYATDPSPTQLDQLSSHAGAVRYAYNYGLNKILTNWKNVREGTETDYINSSAYSLRKLFNQEKQEIAPWWAENNKEAYNTGFSNLERALKNYYAKRSQIPRFKNKFLNDNEGIIFTTNTRRLEADGRHFTVPTIGTLRLHERAKKLSYLLKHGGRVTNVTLKYSRTRWYITITTRVPIELYTQYHLLRTRKDKKKAVGVDVGLKHAAVFSDGTIIENPRSYEKQLRKLRRLNKELARRKKYNKRTGEAPSKRYEKTRANLRKTYAKVSNQERDFTHKLTKRLVDEYEFIGIEDLNVKGMVKNKHLSRSITHAGWGRFKTFLEYKAALYGSEIIKVDRFYPSSKTCSDCGVAKAKLPLSQRTFECGSCGLVIDRDLNAALNIKQEIVAQSCGETLNDHRGASSDPLEDETSTVEMISNTRKVLQPD